MSRLFEALPYRHVLTLPTEPSAVRLSRQTAEQALTEWGISLRHPTVDPALLILGELVTNSVRHAVTLSPSSPSSMRPDPTAWLSPSTTATPTSHRCTGPRSAREPVV